MPNLFIIAGPNGAGKTTAAYTLLPEVLEILEFVNADEIARGLSPFNVDSVAFEAGRLMLQRIDHLLTKSIDFAFETTLATRFYVQTIHRAQQIGYTVSLYYFWVPSADMSKERVAVRVAKGGHNISADVIERRYEWSLSNLARLYTPICDYFTVFNNAGAVPEMIASGEKNIDTDALDNEIWVKILGYESNSRKANS